LRRLGLRLPGLRRSGSRCPGSRWLGSRWLGLRGAGPARRRRLAPVGSGLVGSGLVGSVLVDSVLVDSGLGSRTRSSPACVDVGLGPAGPFSLGHATAQSAGWRNAGQAASLSEMTAISRGQAMPKAGSS